MLLFQIKEISLLFCVVLLLRQLGQADPASLEMCSDLAGEI
tara:strand:+ start:3366 stop:3488 length:123 start_codon:yes stop_codon:yes gene_type:complete